MKIHKTFRIEESLLLLLKEKAVLENRTLSNLVEIILKNYFNEK